MKMLLAAAVVFLSTCGQPKPITPPGPEPDLSFCDLMCARLSELGCEEGKPVYDSDFPGTPGVPNVSCNEFCYTTESRGGLLNPRCVRLVNSCSDIESYRIRDPNTCSE